jgi:hypothetical protein
MRCGVAVIGSIVSDMLKDCGAFIFRVKQSTVACIAILRNVRNRTRNGQQHDAADCNLQQHLFVNLKSHSVYSFSAYSCLKYYMERWLTILLEWDPAKRGCALNKNKEKGIVVFDLIDDILSKKVCNYVLSADYYGKFSIS